MKISPTRNFLRLFFILRNIHYMYLYHARAKKCSEAFPRRDPFSPPDTLASLWPLCSAKEGDRILPQLFFSGPVEAQNRDPSRFINYLTIRALWALQFHCKRYYMAGNVFTLSGHSFFLSWARMSVGLFCASRGLFAPSLEFKGFRLRALFQPGLAQFIIRINSSILEIDEFSFSADRIEVRVRPIKVWRFV